MRLGISNIAWDVAEDPPVAALLQRHEVDAIDVAPGKYFAQPEQATDAEVVAVRRWWSDHGIEITGMQALLFGTSGLQVFGSAESQTALLRRLAAVCRIARLLGAGKLVFGSPKNRDRGTLGIDEAIEQGAAFFRRAGELAAAEGVVLCLEPNPTCYGANFMTTSDETARVVRATAHAAVLMQLDIGAVALNGENPGAVLAHCAGLIGHVHISEPQLLPIGDASTDHAQWHAEISARLPPSVLTIEMLATSTEPHLRAIERALLHASRCYRPERWA